MSKVNQIVLTPHGTAKIIVVDEICKAVRVDHLEATTPITDYRFSDLKIEPICCTVANHSYKPQCLAFLILLLLPGFLHRLLKLFPSLFFKN